MFTVSHQFIQRLKMVKLKVLSLGKIPGSRVALTEYQWMDCYGRPCSPLQMEYVHMTRSDGISESNDSNGTRLLEAEDERKVHWVIVFVSLCIFKIISGFRFFDVSSI